MIISKTPFRMSFFGGGTDFPQWYNTNPSTIISLAIDKYCYISLRESPFASCNYSLRYRKVEQVNKLNEIDHPSIKNCFEFFNCRKKKLELVDKNIYFYTKIVCVLSGPTETILIFTFKLSSRKLI